jgi:DNA-binding transcriptional MocR family regulator
MNYASEIRVIKHTSYNASLDHHRPWGSSKNNNCDIDTFTVSGSLRIWLPRSLFDCLLQVLSVTMLKPMTIDLSKGWPSPSLLPAAELLEASRRVLSDPKLFTPGLLYGPDEGYQPLRQAIAAWLSDFYTSRWTIASRICISGGASQCLACILQVYTDPTYTSNIFMVAPTYHLACRIFEDNGFARRLKAVPEDAEGVDIGYLEKCLSMDEVANGWHSKQVSFFLCQNDPSANEDH